MVDPAELADIHQNVESQRLTTLREKFEDLHDPTHPLRIALDQLQTLDTIRIIEGRA